MTELVSILVSGSRDWPYPGIIRQAIDDIRLSRPKHFITLIHGDCPSGADFQAKTYARELRIPIEAHPADWTAYGRAAGPLRNRKMVEILNDRTLPIFLGFILDQSRGTKGTFQLVQNLHLPWRLYTATSRHPGIVNYSDWQGVTKTMNATLSSVGHCVE
jgi:hypothetical protein